MTRSGASTAPLALLLLLGGGALAQSPPAQPPAAPRDDEDGASGPSGPSLPTHDRPLMRALAYERRDVVEEMLKSPSSLSAASAVELAEDVSIPRPHADKLVEAAKRGLPLETVTDLLRAGLPAGVTPPSNLNLAIATEAELRSRGGMTEAQAKEFMSFRRSARRAYQHFREVRAIREARAAGEGLLAERTRGFLRASTAEKIKTLARGLGLSAPEAEAEARDPRARAEARRRAIEGTAEGSRDPLASFRRTDGTVKWAEFARSQTFSGASGMAHFAFAMFLKELAITLKTGDRGRLEEFVDGLMSTDFFVNYGLFAAGASAADVAYGKFVRRITRKRFLSGVLRSNIVLAAGLAVPMVARGKFELDTYIVDVAALGLSATAVKLAVEGASGVYRLVRGGRGLLTLGRWGTAAGWVYSAGEAAVVLLLSDQIATRLDRFLDERSLRKRVKAAQERLDQLSRLYREGRRVSDGELDGALTDLEDAYDDLRRFEARPLEDRLGRFRSELDDAGRRAHMDDTSLAALRRALDTNPALKENVVRRFGSVEKYLEHADRTRAAPVEERLRAESESFDRDWARLIDETYVGPADGDPAPAEGSRLATYDEETDLLLRAMDGTRDPEARRLIALAIERVRLGRSVDTTVWRSGRGQPLSSGEADRASAPAAPTRSEDTDGLTNALARERGAAPAASTDPVAPTRPAAEAATPTGPSFDEGLPGRMLPGMGPGTPVEVPAATPARPTRRARLPLGEEGTADAEAPAPLPPEQGTLPRERRRAPVAEEGTADAEAPMPVPPGEDDFPRDDLGEDEAPASPAPAQGPPPAQGTGPAPPRSKAE